MMEMQNVITFESKNGYKYLNIMTEKQLYLLDNITYKILRLLESGINIKDVHFFQFFDNNNNLIDKNKILKYISKVNNILDGIDFVWTPIVEAMFTEEDIKHEFFSNPHIVFEVTEKCNLSCKYCAYSEYYKGYDKRTNKDLSINIAKNLLKFVLNSKKGIDVDDVTISFYGGEPLLNINFIKEIVSYSRKLLSEKDVINFTITTNGTLLKRHIDYLVKNKFSIFISLDGNKKNNIYRVYKNGKETFNNVISNISFIRKNYPNYFEKHVNFLSVLHSKNTVDEINYYFQKTFIKYPMISEVAFDSLNAEKKENFIRLFKNKHNKKTKLKNTIPVNVLEYQDPLQYFELINNLNDIKLNDIYKLYFLEKTVNKIIPTGTCLPFQKKIFITTNGKILPCESISHIFSYGKVDEKNVSLDFKSVAKKHNYYLNKISNQCKKCYRVTSCDNCVYILGGDTGKPKCNNFQNKDTYIKYLAESISFLENNIRSESINQKKL